MNQHRPNRIATLTWIASMVLASVAVGQAPNPSSANPQVTNPSRGYAIQFRPVPAPPLSHRTSWTLMQIDSAVLIQWKVSPFVHSTRPDQVSNARISANVRETQGNVQIGPRFTTASTQIEQSMAPAAIAIGTQGTGKVVLDLELTLVNPFAMAGTNVSTVEMTITAP